MRRQRGRVDSPRQRRHQPSLLAKLVHQVADGNGGDLSQRPKAQQLKTAKVLRMDGQ